MWQHYVTRTHIFQFNSMQCNERASARVLKIEHSVCPPNKFIYQHQTNLNPFQAPKPKLLFELFNDLWILCKILYLKLLRSFLSFVMGRMFWRIGYYLRLIIYGAFALRYFCCISFGTFAKLIFIKILILSLEFWNHNEICCWSTTNW